MSRLGPARFRLSSKRGGAVMARKQRGALMGRACFRRIANGSNSGQAMLMPTPTREQLLKSAFPEGVPRRWCPPLTHYDERGALDVARMAAHWRHLSVPMRGFLVPGSTGDGWELTPAERRQTIGTAIELAQQLNVHVLIGALHPDAGETLKLIGEDLEWLCARTAQGEAAKALAQAHVCGFTVYAPRGRDLTQEEIRRGLSAVLELGLPTAIYQLPQVTFNEIHPGLATDLA